MSDRQYYELLINLLRTFYGDKQSLDYWRFSPMNAAQKLLVAVSIAALTALIPAQTASASEPHYSRQQIKQMMRDAHTPEQYRVLGVWFRSQQQMFEEKAAAEEKEWVQRIGGYKVDPARNLYDYYVEKAKEMGARAGYYERWSTQ
jgi:hypothetical protein